MGLLDIVPTLGSAAGANLPEDLEGHNLAPVVQGEQQHVRQFFAGAIDDRYLIDDGTYRYLYHTDDGVEQLFRSEDRDDHSLCDSDLMPHYRQALIDWLTRIGSSDVVDGTLVNQQLTKPSVAACRAQRPLGLGHAGRNLQFGGSV